MTAVAGPKRSSSALAAATNIAGATTPAFPAASGVPFEAARRAILNGRPGVWFCAAGQVALEPWIVATIYRDRLCWRDYSRELEHGEPFEAAWSWADSFGLLQRLWDALADGPAPVAAQQPALPVWLAYELGACLEPAVRRQPAQVRTAERRDDPLAGFLIPRAWATARTETSHAHNLEASREVGRRLWQVFATAVQSTARCVPAITLVPSSPAPVAAPAPAPAPVLTAERTEYLNAVARVQNYIRAGDVYQVNVTRRIPCRPAAPTVSTASASTGDWFTAILDRHPAQQASFWSHIGASTSGTQHFLSFTPERLLSIQPMLRGNAGDGTTGLVQLHTSPIKGTRPRPPEASPARLTELANELMADPKEQAELNMIIDMARNDLGRVARTGSVKVVSSGRIDPLPFVLHRVADVTAEAATPLNLLSLLRAVFPGASVTGAPKIRAMQIIEELESTPRGIYCGALGWLGHGYSADLALAIRTLEATDAGGTFGVGAGIVADSEPEREWQETVAKSRGIVE
ncbi:MAG TPA: anthranilate synthase component I family protein [Planctomycetota bacterium]|nr:anthranilate synthase component I family protein [Planctomycetota bacterium]